MIRLLILYKSFNKWKNNKKYFETETEMTSLASQLASEMKTSQFVISKYLNEK